ncbi:hypothetical protein HY501_03260 [Candidatus Woesearchaeota archaeon]|nr:hypothetical protein [Candidatus Woesearchaeota archaeon]
MSTKFILDRDLLAEQRIVEQVIGVVKKDPYPDQRTQHLATFVHALFQAAMEKRKDKEKKAEPKAHFGFQLPQKTIEPKQPAALKRKQLPPAPMPHRKRLEIPEPPKRTLAHLAVPEPPKVDLANLQIPETKTAPLANIIPPLESQQTLEELVPKSPDLKKIERQEYVVPSFNTPIGVVVDYDEFGKLKYSVIEPQVMQEHLAKVKELIKKDFQKNPEILDNMEFLKEHAVKAARKLNMPEPNDIMVNALKYHLKRDLLGFRRIDPLMQDLGVNAIYIDGVNKPVVIEFNGKTKMQTNIIFTDPQDLNVLLSKLARVTGNTIDDDHPVLDIIFEGFRIQAVKGVGGASSRLIIKKVAL